MSPLQLLLVVLPSLVHSLMRVSVRTAGIRKVGIDGVGSFFDSSVSCRIGKLAFHCIQEVLFERLLSLPTRFIRTIPIIFSHSIPPAQLCVRVVNNVPYCTSFYIIALYLSFVNYVNFFLDLYIDIFI